MGRRRNDRPREAFLSGFYEKTKSKRIADEKYVKHYYYLPNSLNGTLRFLKKYFQILDNPLPRRQVRRRTSPMEFADVAIFTIWEIRSRISGEECIIAGTQTLGPIPWAIFGYEQHSIGNKLAKNYFRTLDDVFDHYSDFIEGSRGFNCNVILHREDLGNDSLMQLSNYYGKSVNYILATAILLLSDLIRNCGPDANEFQWLFSNDRSQSQKEVFEHWKELRPVLLPGENDLKPTDILPCHYKYTTQSYSYKNYSKYTYSEVTLESHAVNIDSIVDGEKIIIFQPKQEEVLDTDAIAPWDSDAYDEAWENHCFWLYGCHKID